ncbi:MAG: helix-turn-helix domain-containing protein [Myxococcales bacterium]|nr:helix-turn-helix domain-containing protein [Myxococcales bacterium]MCB9508277.1 helix-turn-helix domain-containing protein [Myxococcales bacterium]
MTSYARNGSVGRFGASALFARVADDRSEYRNTKRDQNPTQNRHHGVAEAGEPRERRPLAFVAGRQDEDHSGEEARRAEDERNDAYSGARHQDLDSTGTVARGAGGTDQEVLNAEEVAVFLRVDRKTVYDYANRNQIPHRRLGRRLLFSRSALVAWLGDAGSRRLGKGNDARTT